MTTRPAMAPALIWAIASTASCEVPAAERVNVRGESLVLAGTEPGRLCFDQVVPESLSLRSTFAPEADGCVVYREGADYLVDHAAGTVSRTADSRIPDYAEHCLHGLDDFDHTEFPNVSNHPWFVWADYETSNGSPWAEPNPQGRYLTGTREKLERGGPFKVATCGDSITAGGEASQPAYRFQQRYGAHLQASFPRAEVTVEDVSISGYASRQAIDWFDDYLGKVDSPDLTLIGFGMNDHNIGNTEPGVFRSNLVTIVEMVRERLGGDVILFSAFPPNERWHYGTHRMAEYADATKQAATDVGCAYVDVFGTWRMVLERKDQSSLLGNNINHPNDFGHWLYEQAFEAMRF